MTTIHIYRHRDGGWWVHGESDGFGFYREVDSEEKAFDFAKVAVVTIRGRRWMTMSIHSLETARQGKGFYRVEPGPSLGEVPTGELRPVEKATTQPWVACAGGCGKRRELPPLGYDCGECEIVKVDRG